MDKPTVCGTCEHETMFDDGCVKCGAEPEMTLCEECECAIPVAVYVRNEGTCGEECGERGYGRYYAQVRAEVDP